MESGAELQQRRQPAVDLHLAAGRYVDSAITFSAVDLPAPLADDPERRTLGMSRWRPWCPELVGARFAPMQNPVLRGVRRSPWTANFLDRSQARTAYSVKSIHPPRAEFDVNEPGEEHHSERPAQQHRGLSQRRHPQWCSTSRVASTNWAIGLIDITVRTGMPCQDSGTIVIRVDDRRQEEHQLHDDGDDLLHVAGIRSRSPTRSSRATTNTNSNARMNGSSKSRSTRH